MPRPARPDLHLWTVTNWLSRREPHGHEFSLWVSPLFLQAAAKADYDEEKFQKDAREILRAAGENVADHQRHLSFGKWGLEGIDLLDGGKWLHLEQRPDDVLLSRGGQWSCHNIDHAVDQSALMEIWFSWASYIEAETI